MNFSKKQFMAVMQNKKGETFIKVFEGESKDSIRAMIEKNAPKFKIFSIMERNSGNV